eukprot:Partr_v1_DN28580_c1_g1_i5_m72524 putative RGS
MDFFTLRKRLLTRCDVWTNVDPFLNRDMENPFLHEYNSVTSEKLQDSSELPSAAEVTVWCNSFKDLMTDERGISYFMEFLKGEFSSENLYFLLECRKLDCEGSRDAWQEKAKSIYKRFVAPHSENEINIDSQVRQRVVDKFTDLEAQELKKQTSKVVLDINVFAEAINRVSNLMSKDSYSRFIQSEPVVKLLRQDS